MTCQEFRDHLHEYHDGTLESGCQAAARNHVERCQECRFALQRAQLFGRTLEHALGREAAKVALQPELTQRILRAARADPMGRPAGLRAWQWLTISPFRLLGAGVALVVVLLFTREFRRQRAEEPARQAMERSALGSYSIDVPFQTVTHIFQQQNGTVIDAAITRVTVSHAQFSHAPEPSSPHR